MFLNQKSAENGQKIGNLFSQYFSSVHKNTVIPSNIYSSKIVESNDFFLIICT